MSILNLTCSINIAGIIGGIILDTLSPRDRREASADTDKHFDFRTSVMIILQNQEKSRGCFLKLGDFSSS
jgi:hypothetical protein